MKKNAIILLVSVLSIGLALPAEAQSRREAGSPRRSEVRQNKKVNPQTRAEYMAKQLQLADAEKAKLQALFEKQEAKAIRHREEMKKMREEHRAAMEAERVAQKAELIKIIGNDKYQQLQELRIQRLENENRKLKMNRFKDGKPTFRRDMKAKQFKTNKP